MAEAPLLQRKGERIGVAQPEEEKFVGRCYRGLTVIRGPCRRFMEWLFRERSDRTKDSGFKLERG